MQRVVKKCGVSAWHARPCGYLVKFCFDNNIQGKCYKGVNKADLRSITQLFCLNVKYGDSVIFEIEDENKTAIFEEFLKEL